MEEQKKVCNDLQELLANTKYKAKPQSFKITMDVKERSAKNIIYIKE